MGEHLRLLVDLLLHEVAVVALVNVEGLAARALQRPVHRLAVLVVDVDPVMRQDGEVALLQVPDLVGEGRQRDAVRAEEHLALAFADDERRAAPCADQHVLFAVEQEAERERTLEASEDRLDRVLRGLPAFEFPGDEMADRLGVGLALEGDALGLEFGLELAVVLDDPVMDDGEPLGGMRMGVGLGRCAVRRPAGVADADRALQRLGLQSVEEIDQLALGAPAGQPAVLQRRDAGGIVAAVLQPFQRVDEAIRHRLAADDPDDSTHAMVLVLVRPARGRRPRLAGNLTVAAATAHSRLVTGDYFPSGGLPGFAPACAALAALLRSMIWRPRSGFVTCRSRAIASAPAGTSSVMTLPVPT